IPISKTIGIDACALKNPHRTESLKIKVVLFGGEWAIREINSRGL
ncbi:unnamed protein product, partial [Arabidopsis halleri]